MLKPIPGENLVLVAVRVEADHGARAGLPEGNRLATSLLVSLMQAHLEIDGITATHVGGTGYFNASIYLVEVERNEMQRASIVLDNLMRTSEADGYWIQELPEDGQPSRNLSPDDWREVTRCWRDANETQVMIDASLAEYLLYARQRLEELKRGRDEDDQWKEGQE